MYHQHIKRPFMYPWVISKCTSCTRLYIRRPLVYGYALYNTTTDSSSHIPWVYRETPLGYLIHLRKSLWPSCLEPYTENNIWGDYYARTLEVYHEWHLLTILVRDLTFWIPPIILSVPVSTYSLCREIFGVFSRSLDPRSDRNYTNWLS